MRLFVLAAGKGTRLAPETHDKPKCLVPLHGGRTFVSHLLSLAEHTEYIDEAFVVTGHCSERVDQALEQHRFALQARTIYNPFYEVAGPIVSLWVGIEKMVDQNFLVCNGDTFYTRRAFDQVWTKSRESVRLCVDEVSKPQRDDMKVEYDGQGRLAYVGKDLPVEQADAVSTGFLMVKGPMMRKVFTDTVIDLLHDNHNVQTWQAWHIVLNALAEQDVPVEPVTVHPHDWAEVDTPDELHGLRARVDGHVLRRVPVVE